VLAGELPNIIFISGLVFSLGGVAGAIAAPFWGQFGQHSGFFRTMALALLFAGLALIIQGIPDDLYLFALMQFIGGLFFAGIYPSINAILAGNTPPEFKGSIFGMLFSAQQIGSMAGPVLGGVIATLLGMKYVFFIAGAMLILLSAAVYQHFILHHKVNTM
jgi:DHA1 family multidrug resistance protein-like MFS transporter